MASRKLWEDFKSGMARGAGYHVLTALLGGTGGAIALYDLLKTQAGQWAPFIAVYVGLFLFFGILITTNQYLELRERARRRAAANPTPTMIEKHLRDWLLKFGFQLKYGQPPPIAHFQMIVHDDQGTGLFVQQQRDIPYIVIGSTLQLENDEESARVQSAITRPRSTVLHELQIELAQLGVEYTLKAQGGGRFAVGGPPLERILILHKSIFDESTTDLKFFHDIMLVRRGIALASSVLGRSGNALDPLQDSAKSPEGV
jgi:hypothetical protein